MFTRESIHQMNQKAEEIRRKLYDTEIFVQDRLDEDGRDLTAKGVFYVSALGLALVAVCFITCSFVL